MARRPGQCIHRNTRKVVEQQKDIAKRRIREIAKMRREYYDDGLRLDAIVKKWTECGWHRSEIEDVIYYRVEKGVM